MSLDLVNLDFIKHQIASTEKAPATTYRYLPKRLVDLRTNAQAEPRLIDGRQLEEDLGGVRYATLSYCWGSAEESKSQLRLTAETQRILYHSIPSALMTPVLRDAITVCRLLELRYLWIDSLCIQQEGDNADWEEQSQEMSHIFGNSWLTICALASNSCLEGFLDHVDRHSPTIQIQYVPEKSEQPQGSFFLRLFTLNGEPGFQDDHFIAARAPLVRDIKYSKWNSRGWVFQERILSPRLLYFGSRMVHFQHGSHVTSEDGSSIDGNFPSMLNATRYCSTNLIHQLEMIQKDGPFITDLWYSLVSEFSPSNFTDRRDIFPAIAGVARRVHEFTKHRYLAGLWEEDFYCGLLWSPDLRSEHSMPRIPPASLRQVLRIIKRSTHSIAPSWSWASRRSSLIFLITDQFNTTCRVRRHLRAEFTILESRVIVNGINPYGRIDNASISLFGSTLRLSPDSLSPIVQRMNPRLQLCELFPNLCVFVRPDWAPKAARASGIKKHMRTHFQLLLIASCCSDRRISSHKQAALSPSLGACAEPAPEPAHHPRPSIWSNIIKTPEIMKRKRQEAMKPEYRTSFYEDSHPGFDAAVDCDLCSDHALRRDIWGLLIYPAGPADTFYRVGTFFSRAQHGGSTIFEGTKPRRIDLI